MKRGADRLIGLIRRHRLVTYFALAYTLSWGWWLLSPDHSKVPGLLGPMIAAVATSLLTGQGALRRLASSAIKWRAPWWIAVFVLPGSVAIFGAGLALTALEGKPIPDLGGLGTMPGFPASGPVGLVLVVFVLNGYGEETGWRGFALPALQARRAPLIATLLLALGWATWHIPLFFIRLGIAVPPPMIPVWLLGLLLGAVVLTWIYNRTDGSILWVAAFHTMNNLLSATAAANMEVQALDSTVVSTLGVVLIILEIRAARMGRLSVIGPRPMDSSSESRSDGPSDSSAEAPSRSRYSWSPTTALQRGRVRRCRSDGG